MSRREHSRFELETKLRARGFADDGIAETLDALLAEGLQDDFRYAESYVRSRANRGYGPRRIAQELKQRGVADAVSKTAVRDAQIDWFELAANTQQKKFRKGPESFKERAQQSRFLEYRGFDAEQIRHALETSTDDEDF